MALPKKKIADKTSKLSKELPPIEEGFETVDLIEVEDKTPNTIQPSVPMPELKEEIYTEYEGIDDSGPFLEDEEEEKEYIDKKRKKIKPIGSKAKIRDKDLDDRKNKLIGVKIFRIFVYVVILGLFAMGLKNTLFPQKMLSTDEITAISQKAIGKTGFPEYRGQAFARDFLKAYLNMDNSKASKQLLGKFYTGQLGESDGGLRTGKSAKESQMKVIGEPVLFDSLLVSEKNASFKFNVYTSDTDGKDTNQEGYTTGQWLAFQVNVYWDKKTDTISIVDSPTMIPTYSIKKPETLPNAVKIGTGETDDDMVKKLTPTINGFLKSYANVDINNYEEILQYIDKKSPQLISGFGGTVKIKNGENTIIKTVYKTKEPNVWKVDITLDWQTTQTVNEELAPAFTSRYVMTIKKTNGNVYLVTKFVPYVYVSDNSKQ